MYWVFWFKFCYEINNYFFFKLILYKYLFIFMLGKFFMVILYFYILKVFFIFNCDVGLVFLIFIVKFINVEIRK